MKRGKPVYWELPYRTVTAFSPWERKRAHALKTNHGSHITSGWSECSDQKCLSFRCLGSSILLEGTQGSGFCSEEQRPGCGEARSQPGPPRMTFSHFLGFPQTTSTPQLCQEREKVPAVLDGPRKEWWASEWWNRQFVAFPLWCFWPPTWTHRMWKWADMLTSGSLGPHEGL